MDTNLMPKNAKILHCNYCDFSCSKESNWQKHLLTSKHKRSYIRVTTDTLLVPKNAENCQISFTCECGNGYKFRQGLYKHKKTCSYEVPLASSANKTDITQKLVELIMSKNQEFMTELVSNITNSNKDVMEKMMEIIPTIGNITNHTNSHNTTNNQFNIQMFLNEHCKNAMNLTDFIDTLPITASTYDSTIENGLTKTITNMITNGLNKLDILERPIHCTDATRKTLYVKEADIWEKDTDLIKVVDSIKTLIRKKRTLISRWKEANRGWDTVESKQMRFTELICNIMTDVDFDEKETGKIVRSISKSVYLDNEDKKKYLC
jgi:hypothetical protein